MPKPLTREIRFVIPEARAGEALLDFLAQRFPYHDRKGWLKRIEEGRILVGGRKADSGRLLAAGDELEYEASDIPESPVDLAVTVLYEDDDLLAVNKSGNLPCHPGGRYFNHTLWSVLKTRFGIEAPNFIHRLDRETSGVVLLGKTPEAVKGCRRQFEKHRVDKRYLAIVEGAFPTSQESAGWLVNDPAVVRKKRRYMPVEGRPGEEPEDGAEWVEGSFRLVSAHGPVSLVEVKPRTGRLHQIRAMLQGLGFPVAGDKVYGMDPGIFLRFCQDAMTDEDRARVRLKRQALHAASVRLKHPRTGRELLLEAPIPDDMTAILHKA